MSNQPLLPAIALTLAFPAATLAADAAQTLTVVMVDNRFEPDHITFHAGQTYVLRLENHGKDMHEFTASAFLQGRHHQGQKQTGQQWHRHRRPARPDSHRDPDNTRQRPLRPDLRRPRLGRHGRQHHSRLAHDPDRPRAMNVNHLLNNTNHCKNKDEHPRPMECPGYPFIRTPSAFICVYHLALSVVKFFFYRKNRTPAPEFALAAVGLLFPRKPTAKLPPQTS